MNSFTINSTKETGLAMSNEQASIYQQVNNNIQEKDSFSLITFPLSIAQQIVNALQDNNITDFSISVDNEFAGRTDFSIMKVANVVVIKETYSFDVPTITDSINAIALTANEALELSFAIEKEL